MKAIRFRRPLAVCVCCGILAGLLVVSTARRAAGQAPLPLDKASRTPAEQKIDSQLLIEIVRRDPRSVRKNALLPKTAIRIDGKQRAYVDVRADVTPALLKTIRSLGSDVVSTSAEYRSILAWIPLLKMRQLAGDPLVQSIMPAAQAINNQPSESGAPR
jgi:hypothetical protein